MSKTILAALFNLTIVLGIFLPTAAHAMQPRHAGACMLIRSCLESQQCFDQLVDEQAYEVAYWYGYNCTG